MTFEFFSIEDLRSGDIIMKNNYGDICLYVVINVIEKDIFALKAGDISIKFVSLRFLHSKETYITDRLIRFT